MKDKIWHSVKFQTEDQKIEIYPTETFDGIVLETKDSDDIDDISVSRLYLSQYEIELLITKINEMMVYLKQ
jgi:hypothetical protein